MLKSTIDDGFPVKFTKMCGHAYIQNVDSILSYSMKIYNFLFEFTRCVVIISNFTLYNEIYFHFKYEELKTTIINRNFKAVVSNKMIRHDMLK